MDRGSARPSRSSDTDLLDLTLHSVDPSTGERLTEMHAIVPSRKRLPCEYQPVTDLHSALAAGRTACLSHMNACETAGLQWTEEPVTEILLSRTYPLIRSATFTRQEEGRVGADCTRQCTHLHKQVNRRPQRAQGRPTYDRGLRCIGGIFPTDGHFRPGDA